MDGAGQLEAAIDLFGRFGVKVRREHLGGAGSCLCEIRGERVMYVDLDADLATQIDGSAAALAQIPEIETTYLPPELRERVDRARRGA